MDVYEVSVAEYQTCVEKGACPAPNACTENRHWGPKTSEVCAGPDGAEAYCRWRGLRLATFDEWVRADSNGDSRYFPWGSEVLSDNKGVCACRELEDGPCETRRETRDVSAHGIRDLGANALEWISGGRCLGQGWWYQEWPPSVWSSSESCDSRHPQGNYCGIRCVADPLPVKRELDNPPPETASTSEKIGGAYRAGVKARSAKCCQNVTSR